MSSIINTQEKKDIISGVFGENFTNILDDIYLNSLTNEKLNNLIQDKDSENDINPLIDELYNKEYETILPMSISHPSLHINGKIFDKEVNFLVDTGAMNCIIDYTLAKEIGLDEYIDKTNKTILLGVGQNISIGKIPYVELDIEGSLFPINLTVMEFPKDNKKTSTKAILGLNFLMFYNANIDLKKRKIHIMNMEKNLIVKDK